RGRARQHYALRHPGAGPAAAAERARQDLADHFGAGRARHAVSRAGALPPPRREPDQAGIAALAQIRLVLLFLCGPDRARRRRRRGAGPGRTEPAGAGTEISWILSRRPDAMNDFRTHKTVIIGLGLI